MKNIISHNTDEIVLVDKPRGISSYDVIRNIKRNYPKGTKIGHTGTLDPFASGLLILLIGRNATKKQDEFHKLKKTYEVLAYFGKETDTLDSTGKVVVENDLVVSEEQIENEIKKNFLGIISQIPPKFSAVHVNGKRAYQLARDGVEFTISPKDIEIFEFRILKYEWPNVSFIVTCGSGTYIRSLISDLARNLNTFAYCMELRRIKIGEYDVQNAKKDVK